MVMVSAERIKVLLINPSMPYEVKRHLQTALGLCYLSSIVKPIAESIVLQAPVLYSKLSRKDMK